MKLKKRLAIVSLFLCILLVSTPSYGMTIRINAPKISLDLSPGEVYTGEIVAENPEDTEVKVKIYLEDWIYKDGGTGEKIFTPMGSTPLSAAQWINFSPSEEVLKPFGRVTVHYTITVPLDAEGGYYAALFFETLLGTTANEEGAIVNVAGRIGSLFFINAKGTVERSGRIGSVDIRKPEGNKPLEITTRFQNTGNVDISLGGNFLVMDTEGKVQARGDLNKIYTFPGSIETGKTQWVGRLSNGGYDVLLTYDLGDGKSLVEEKKLAIE